MAVPESGGPNAALLRRAADFLRSQSPVLIVAATRAAADDAVRLCCAGSGRALAGVYRQTLRDLVLTMSEGPMLERGLRPIRRIAREAIAAEIAARFRTRLSYLAPVIAFPGFPRALARTLEDLRLNRITAAQLESAGRSGSDLAVLLDAYESALAEQKFADHALRCELSMEAIESRALLLLDLDIRNRREQELLRAVQAAAPAVLDLRRLSPHPPEAAASPPATRLRSLQNHVLTGEPAPALPPDGTVSIFSASGEALECVEVARRILRLARRGTRFDRIAVLLRSAGRHQPLIHEALRRARIPAWYSQGVRRPDVSGRAFLALLRCAAEDLSASRFTEYLSLGQVPAEEEQSLLTSRWERLLARAAVISGLDRWERRLEGEYNRLSAALEAAETDEERSRLARELTSLEALRGFALPVVRGLHNLPEAASWGEWLEALAALARRTLGQPARILEVLAELEPMAAIGPVALHEVIATLEPELATLRREEEQPRYGHVFVASLEEVAGMSFEAVFVPGLNEGIFPKPVREDPLLLDSQRATLGLEGSRDDASLLQTAVAAAEQQFICSWSRIDLTTGRERVPSFYAFEVAESAGYGELDVRNFIREARDNTEARLGWPAPADRDDAVDAAEYDLAALRPYWDVHPPGAAAWLKLANGHLYRSLQARRLRWTPQWTWADGLTDTDVHVGLEMEKRHSLAVRSYAPTRLEQYARCPYRFYLQSIVGLRPVERPAAMQRIDPGVRGELYHEVQSRFYTQLAAEGALPVSPAALEEALKRLEAVAREVEGEFAERCKPAIPLVWNTDLERIRGDLRGWLRYVALTETEWTPALFELEFDKVEIAPRRLLQGRIDLIEEHAGGALRITDHKTGRPPEENRIPQQIGGGEFLQPVLYAMAASAKLGKPVAGARLFYATLRGNYTVLPIRLAPETRESAEMVLDAIDKAIRNADMPAAPRAEACEYCDYLPVCGPYEELRVGLKSRRPELHQIRSVR